MKRWDVWVNREGRSIVIGQVGEQNETLARCAALCRYGVNEDEMADGESGQTGAVIRPDEEFSVSAAGRSG